MKSSSRDTSITSVIPLGHAEVEYTQGIRAHLNRERLTNGSAKPFCRTGIQRSIMLLAVCVNPLLYCSCYLSATLIFLGFFYSIFAIIS